MTAHYRHTQVGWAIVFVLAAIALLMAASLPAEARAAARAPIAVLALVLLLFCALSVEVDLESIRVWFGPGLIRKRIPLAEVAGWRAVRNPWYVGWGIRAGPHGMIWNVSGLDAVELDLSDDRRFRIGTDEPEALVTAISQAKGVASSPPPAEPAAGAGRGGSAGRRGAVTLVVVLLGLLAIGGMIWLQSRPVGVRVSAGGIEIDTLLYGTTLPADEIVVISLEPTLPRILARTGGFAAAGSLRGRFRLAELGDGRLFVERGHPPYLYVRLKQGFVFVNLPEPQRTRALYDAAARQWPERAAVPR